MKPVLQMWQQKVPFAGFWKCWDICSFAEIIKQAFQRYQTIINWGPTFEDGFFWELNANDTTAFEHEQWSSSYIHTHS